MQPPEMKRDMPGNLFRVFTAVCVALVTLAACTAIPPDTDISCQSAVITPTPEPLPRIAVATAYGPELAALLPLLEDPTEYELNGVSFWTGNLGSQPVVLFKTGVSVVNATMNTQLLLDHFNVSHILVSGVAGGLDPDLSIGDVTVPDRWAKFDEATYLRETAPGTYTAPPGLEPVVPPYSFIGTRGARIANASDPAPAPRLWFEADPGLVAIAKDAAAHVSLEQCDSNGLCLPEVPEVVTGGSGVTGSIFMDNRDFREYLHSAFGADVVEMETAAIAMVSYANGVPYIAFRSLSDLAGGGQANENEIRAFERLAARNSAAFVLAYLETYSDLSGPQTGRDGS